MKLSSAQIKQALAKPDPKIAAVVVFGPDTAQIRERALAFAASVADVTDPFQCVELTAAQCKEDPARLADEAAALSFLGGRKVVRIDAQASNALAESLTEPLAFVAQADPVGNLIVISAGDLAKTSKLRQLAESAGAILGVACYAEEGRAIESLLQEHAAHLGYHLARDAAQHLAQAIGSERDVGRREVEKLGLYVGAGREITVQDVDAAAAGLGVAAFDKLINAIFNGSAGLAQQQLDRLFEEGESGIAILRMASRRAWQLLHARLAMAEGLSADAAIDRLRPPVFWKEKDALIAQARQWPLERLSAALEHILQTEIAAKSGRPDGDLLVAHALLELTHPSGFEKGQRN